MRKLFLILSLFIFIQANSQRLARIGVIASSAQTSISYDSNATNFFNACAAAGHALTTHQKTAVNNFVLNLKTYNLWAKEYAVYPIVGGDNSTVVINLIHPGTYNLILHNTPTVDTAGITFDGKLTWANTGFNSHNLSLSAHMSVYCRTQSPSVGYMMGTYNDWTCIYVINSARGGYGMASPAMIGVNGSADWRGFYTVSRNNNDTICTQFNGTVLLALNSTGNYYNGTIYIGCLNYLGSMVNYCGFQCDGAEIGIGLNSTELSNLYNYCWLPFQTALYR